MKTDSNAEPFSSKGRMQQIRQRAYLYSVDEPIRGFLPALYESRPLCRFEYAGKFMPSRYF